MCLHTLFVFTTLINGVQPTLAGLEINMRGFFAFVRASSVYIE
jgi:hypothetical protein